MCHVIIVDSGSPRPQASPLIQRFWGTAKFDEADLFFS